jgi:copper chaperone CopZ
MNSLKKIMMAALIMLSITTLNAQIKNTKTDPSVSEQVTQTVKIFGNCGMCKKNIEKAGTIEGIVSVKWDKDTKIATLVYDAQKTHQEEILNRIALAGYDSEKYKAKKEDYDNLDGCCQYEREN